MPTGNLNDAAVAGSPSDCFNTELRLTLMKFLIVSFYHKMTDDGDEHPVLRTMVYISMVLIALELSLILLIEPVISWLFFILGYSFKEDFRIFAFVLCALMTPILLYHYLRKKLASILETRQPVIRNRFVRGLVLFLTPMLLFLAGPTLRVILFGGSIMRYSTEGIITPILK